ncbi:UNVERIFIED_CONTAM: nucleotide-binding universal stress UspA family protein [Brevibacillus sp. OAP136]
MYQRILVPVDGSAHARHAVRSARWIAQSAGQDVKVTLLHVNPSITLNEVAIDVDDIDQIQEEEGRKIVTEAQELFEDTELQCEAVCRFGNPAKTICEMAKEGNYDLIVMGSRGLGLLKEMLIGSVSHDVIQGAHCPVLIVK